MAVISVATNPWVPLLAAACARPCGRAGVPMAAIATDPATTKAADQLLEEVAKPERSLTTIAELVKTLEDAGLPPTAGKQKKALVGDWRVEYASDDAVIAPFLTGPLGPFTVLEGVIHSVKETGEFNSIEVKRRLGPFGNSKQTLGGRWSITSPAKEKRGAVVGKAERGGAADVTTRWKASYLIDSSGRERDAPSSSEVNEARVAHASSRLLLLRIPADSIGEAGLLVFSKVQLKKVLDEFNVADPV